MIQRVHKVMALMAMLCVAVFFSSTLMVELAGDAQAVALVKSLIVMPGLFILIPAIALTGITGNVLAKQRKGRLVTAKQQRMKRIAAAGILLLVPCALILNRWAAAGEFSGGFYALQVVELLAGATNLLLMLMNARDGRRLSRTVSG